MKMHVPMHQREVCYIRKNLKFHAATGLFASVLIRDVQQMS